MKEKDNTGLSMAARYATQPNMWGFCGEDSSQQILRDFLTKKNIAEDLVMETLSKHGFPHLNAFLETIAKISDLDKFDEDVVMSYWFGGILTENIYKNSKPVLIEKYSEQISPEFAAALEKTLPEDIYLTHLTQVAFIAAADYEPLEKITLINHCMIAYGKILEIDSEHKMAKVERDILIKNLDRGYKVARGVQMVKIDPDLSANIEVDCDVTVHLGYLAGKIPSEQAEILRYWTRKVAEVI